MKLRTVLLGAAACGLAGLLLIPMALSFAEPDLRSIVYDTMSTDNSKTIFKMTIGPAIMN